MLPANDVEAGQGVLRSAALSHVFGPAMEDEQRFLFVANPAKPCGDRRGIAAYLRVTSRAQDRVKSKVVNCGASRESFAISDWEQGHSAGRHRSRGNRRDKLQGTKGAKFADFR